MGLDQHLTGRKYFWQSFKNPDGDRMEDDHRIKAIELDLGYWRKHPDLHGFIVQAFAEGSDECQEIELDESAIRCVISAVKEERLPKTTGFFFGASDPKAVVTADGRTEKEEDVRILEAALAWLQGQPQGVVPKLGEELPLGDSGMVMRVLKPVEPDALARETRTVVYRASW